MWKALAWLHHFTKRGVWAPKTSLTPPLFIGVPVPSEWAVMYLCERCWFCLYDFNIRYLEQCSESVVFFVFHFTTITFHPSIHLSMHFPCCGKPPGPTDPRVTGTTQPSMLLSFNHVKNNSMLLQQIKLKELVVFCSGYVQVIVSVWPSPILIDPVTNPFMWNPCPTVFITIPQY